MSKKRIKKMLTNHTSFIPKPQRYKLLRYLIRIPDPPDDITFQTAESSRDRDAAFALLYDVYRKKNLTAPCPSKKRITIYHSLASTVILVAKQHDDVVATVSVIKDDRFGMPSQDLVDPDPFRIPGKCLAEVSSLALRGDLHGQCPAVMFYLSKYLFKFSREHFGVDRFIISFHPGQLALYEGVFLFKPLHARTFEQYEFANNAPAVCATSNLETVESRFRKVYGNAAPRRNLYHFFFKAFTAKEAACMRFPDPAPPVQHPPVPAPFFPNRTRPGMRPYHRQAVSSTPKQ